MRKQHEDCGCTHDGERWLSLCAQHSSEYHERHERAGADHRRKSIPDPAPDPAPEIDTFSDLL